MQLFLMSDVARMLRVPAHRITYGFLTNKYPQPQLKLGNRRIFTLDDLRRIAKAMGKDIKEENDNDAVR